MKPECLEKLFNCSVIVIQVIIHHTRRLHVGIADYRSEETEASAFHISAYFTESSVSD